MMIFTQAMALSWGTMLFLWVGMKHSICAIFRFECHGDLYMGDSVMNVL